MFYGTTSSGVAPNTVGADGPPALCQTKRRGGPRHKTTLAVFTMTRLLVLLAALLPVSTFAAEVSTAKKEIEHLIRHLGSSGCQFNRNGSWHASERAVNHLKRKYDYLLKRNLVPSAEAFIKRAASESSVSGKPYLVKCGDAAAVPSAKWLLEELESYRASDG